MFAVTHFLPPGDILEDDDDYLDELSQPVVSDSELGGEDLSEGPGSTAAAPPSKSPALTKKKQQQPTYKGSVDLPALRSLRPERWLSGMACPSRVSAGATRRAGRRLWALRRRRLPARWFFSPVICAIFTTTGAAPTSPSPHDSRVCPMATALTCSYIRASLSSPKFLSVSPMRDTHSALPLCRYLLDTSLYVSNRTPFTGVSVHHVVL